MAIPGTDNQDPLFISDFPDWSETVELEIRWETGIHQARDGTEQRTRGQQFPKHKISFTISALNAAQYAARRARAHLETKLPIVVPLWPIQLDASGPGVGQVVTVDQTPQAVDGFRIDQWICLEEAGEVTFKKIEEVDGNEITIVGAMPTLTAESKIYPCTIGARADGCAFLPGQLNSIDERIVISGL